MAHRTRITPRAPHRINPLEALRGRAWLDQALTAVAGMWRDRRDVDPVVWQRKLRAEWEKNADRRLRRTRSKSRR